MCNAVVHLHDAGDGRRLDRGAVCGVSYLISVGGPMEGQRLSSIKISGVRALWLVLSAAFS